MVLLGIYNSLKRVTTWLVLPCSSSTHRLDYIDGLESNTHTIQTTHNQQTTTFDERNKEKKNLPSSIIMEGRKELFCLLRIAMHAVDNADLVTEIVKSSLFARWQKRKSRRKSRKISTRRRQRKRNAPN